MQTKRILLLEDDGEQARSLADYLEDVGYLCKVVANEADALTALFDNRFDAAIFDINLKDSKTGMRHDQSGLELAQKIRQQGMNIPLMFFTAYDKSEQVSDAEITNSFFLRKGVALKELALNLTNLLVSQPRLSEAVAKVAMIEVADNKTAAMMPLLETDIVLVATLSFMKNIPNVVEKALDLNSGASVKDVERSYVIDKNGQVHPVLRRLNDTLQLFDQALMLLTKIHKGAYANPCHMKSWNSDHIELRVEGVGFCTKYFGTENNKPRFSIQVHCGKDFHDNKDLIIDRKKRHSSYPVGNGI